MIPDKDHFLLTFENTQHAIVLKDDAETEATLRDTRAANGALMAD